jgi:preprotein translocase subunit SecD
VLLFIDGPLQYGEEIEVDEPAVGLVEMTVQLDPAAGDAASIVIEVPQGTRVIAEFPEDDPTTDTDESQGAAEYFVIRDRAELSGTDITNPEQSSDQTTSQPNVTFDFTDEGRQAFETVTRRIAQRGQAEANFFHPYGFLNPQLKTATLLNLSLWALILNINFLRLLIHFLSYQIILLLSV